VEFEIVTLESSYVAGLTIPLAGREVTRKDLDLVNFTWDRYLARGRSGPRVAVYTAQDGRSAAVLGYDVKGLDDVEAGDVITRVPAGRYAKFVVSGKPYDLTRTAWAEVAKAESAGMITRSHVTDVERFVDAESVEVFVSLV
jgi:predicted transcriptional regulator YdeE